MAAMVTDEVPNTIIQQNGTAGGIEQDCKCIGDLIRAHWHSTGKHTAVVIVINSRVSFCTFSSAYVHGLLG